MNPRIWSRYCSCVGSLASTKAFVHSQYPLLRVNYIFSHQHKMVVTRSRRAPAPTSLVFPTTIFSLAAINDDSPSANISMTLTPTKRGRSAQPVTPSPTKTKKRKTSSPNKLSKEESTISPEVWTLTQQDLACVNPDQPYLDLKVTPEELRPSATLTNGQSFVWKAVEQPVPEQVESNEFIPAAPTNTSAWGSHNATEWVGVLRIDVDESIVVAIRETPTTTLYRPLIPTNCDLKDYLKQYFQLDEPLRPLYDEWAKSDARLATIAKLIPGVRVLDQDPWECLVSFICSSNNNIPRITKMLSAIRREYGRPLVTIGNQVLYSFPSAESLLERATDQDLRQKCGMGYRAKYILETLQILQKHGGESYLEGLRAISDPIEVQTKLCEFCGVGRKVADCVALFSLRQDDAIPIDTHVWNIARRDYDPDGHLATVKSLTPTTYRLVGDLFRSIFPRKAGWANSLLFVAELPSFRPLLPDHIVQEMDNFQQEEQARKKIVKEAKRQKKEVLG